MEFFDVLVRYEVSLWNAVDDALKREGDLSAAHLQALDVVHRFAGAGRVQDVSSQIGITVGAASKTVDRLEKDGLVERRPNPADRRSSVIVLTDTGASAYRGGVSIRARVFENVLEPEAVKTATEALMALQSRLDLVATEVPA